MLDASVIQRQASEPTASVWVNASAGTGKTKVLTDRVLRLLLSGVIPSRILCLTFTKAGAAEMAIRLQRRLGQWMVMDDPELDAELVDLIGSDFKPDTAWRQRARALFRQVLEAPGGLPIQTIHSFCTSLLRRFPVEAGVSPRFHLIEEEAARAVLHEARDRVLQDGGQDPQVQMALDFLTAQQDSDRFTKAINSLIEERGRLARELRRVDGSWTALEDEIYEIMGVERGVTTAHLRHQACGDPNRDEPALRHAVEQFENHPERGKNDNAKAKALADFLAAEQVQRPYYLEAYLSVFLKKDGGVRAVSGLAKKALGEDVQATMLAEAERLQTWTTRWRAAAVAEASIHLLRVGRAILDRYERVKRQQHVLDFSDLILTSRALLQADGKAAWVLYKLDEGIDHLLIDEAQDTNPEQWDIVQAMAHEFFAGLSAAEDRGYPLPNVGEEPAPISLPRSLFVVGDEKQSIFSFQRASPETFKTMRATFGAQVTAAERDWRPVALAKSFRTSPPVLQLVDQVFTDPLAMAGVAPDDGQAVEHQSSRGGQAGRVMLWSLEPYADTGQEREQAERLKGPVPWVLPPEERVDERSARQRLADRLAQQISEWLSRGTRLEPYDRPVCAGDILVLVRRRNAFIPALVRALQAHNIPVAGADRMVLPDQLAVRDLLALAEFLLLPTDDLTLACVLKTPFIGFDDALLENLAIGRDASLWEALQHAASSHSTSGHTASDHAASGQTNTDQGMASKAAEAHAYLAHWLTQVDFLSPYDLFAGVLSQPCPAKPSGTGREALLWRLGADVSEPLDEFLDRCLLFEREHPAVMQHFLDWLATSAPEIKRDQDAAGNQLRIMTVHGSKGLQAPIVILPDTTQLPKPPEAQPLWPVDLADPGPPVFAPSTTQYVGAAQDRYDQIRQRQREEYNRLLYVALTRAADWLLVCGMEPHTAVSDQSWYAIVERAFAALTKTDPAVETMVDGLLVQDFASPQTAAPKPDATLVDVPVGQDAIPVWARQVVPDDLAGEALKALTPSGHGALEASAAKGDGEPPVASPIVEQVVNRALVRGRLVHTLLQWLPDTAHDYREPRLHTFLAQPVHGLTSDDQHALAQEVMTILNDDQFAPLFGPGSLAEVSVSGRIITADGDEAVINGEIDRLVALDDRVLIVDYKTNRPPPRQVEDIPDVYRRQLAFYVMLVRQLYPGKTVEAALLWTYEARLQPVPEALMAPFFPKA
ncbi:MAG: double-strand break repair helicase AddA [Pseudomonadota bacterium]